MTDFIDEFVGNRHGTLKKNPKSKKKRECGLTDAQSLRIRGYIKKCEIKGCTEDAYKVHHIRFCSEDGDNRYGNLIVLCSNHHDDIHGRNPNARYIPTKTELYQIVKERTKRNPRIADLIKKVLRTHKKSQTEKKIPKKNDPVKDLLGY